jgi:hypothetical protein
MNEIAQMVAQKFNLSPEVAQQLVGFILTQIKGKLPEGMSSQLDGLMAGGIGGGDAGGLFDKFKDMAGGMFEKS